MSDRLPARPVRRGVGSRRVSALVEGLESRQLLTAALSMKVDGKAVAEEFHEVANKTQGSDGTVTVTLSNTGDTAMVLSVAEQQSTWYDPVDRPENLQLNAGQSATFKVVLSTAAQGVYYERFNSSTGKFVASAPDTEAMRVDWFDLGSNASGSPLLGFRYLVDPPSAATPNKSFGTLTSTDQGWDSTVSFRKVNDARGETILRPKVDVAKMVLPAASSTVTMQFRGDPLRDGNGVIRTGSLQFKLVPDLDNDGLMDLAERSSATVQTWTLAMPSTSTPSTMTKVVSLPSAGVSTRTYFVETRVASVDPVFTPVGGEGSATLSYGMKVRGVAVAAAKVELTTTSGSTTTTLANNSTVNLGAAAAGSAMTRKFTLKNASTTATMTITGITISNTKYEVAEGLPATLAPGASNDFTIELADVTAGTKTATVTVKTNGDVPSFVINLSATLVTPIGQLQWANGTARTTVPTGASAQGKYGTYFGGALVGTTPATTVFYLKNTSTSATANITGVAVPAGFKVVTALPSSVAAGGQAKLELRLDTASARTAAGKLSFNVNGLPYTVGLFGVAMAAGKAVLATTAQGAPQNTVFVAGTNSSTTADSIAIKPDGTDYRFSVNGVVTKFAQSGVSRIEAYGYAGNDSIGLTGAVPASLVYGGDGNDVISGGNGNDSLYGDAGNDSVYGNLGNDQLFGGSGDDKLFGGDGTDSLTGNAGRDTYDGGAGADTAFLDSTDNPTRISVEVLK